MRWITDRGELHEWYLGEWRQEHLRQDRPADYRVICLRLEDLAICGHRRTVSTDRKPLLADSGITVGQLWRTPLMEIQIDLAGLERFSMDLADEAPELMDLVDLMTDHAAAAVCGGRQDAGEVHQALGKPVDRDHRPAALPGPARSAVSTNCSTFSGRPDKRLLVHYDGKLRLISDLIAAVGHRRHRFVHAPARRRHECCRGPGSFGPTSSFGSIRRWAGIARTPPR